MLRSGAPRTLLRSFKKMTSTVQFVHTATLAPTTATFKQRSFALKRPEPLALTAYRPQTAVIRSYATGAVPGTYQNLENEAKYRAEFRLEPETSLTSSRSTGNVEGEQKEEEDVDMMAGMRHDLKVIKDTFALNDVPKEALNIGLAGVLPYLATSAATVYCAWEVSNAGSHGGLGFILSGNTAELCLHVLEPLQVGYGAVILSFLGAIHWGLEWAHFGGTGGYRRYAIGVIAPAVAWPTVLMPVEYALISQFLAFVFLYAADSSATIRGWAPPWYSTYRFVLTFVVGVSIVISLIGRGQVWGHIDRAPGALDRVKELRDGIGEEKGKKGKGKKRAVAKEEDAEEEDDE